MAHLHRCGYLQAVGFGSRILLRVSTLLAATSVGACGLFVARTPTPTIQVVRSPISADDPEARAKMDAIERAIVDLQTRHEAERARLDVLLREAREAELEAERAKVRAARERCRADGAKFDAGAYFAVAACMSRSAAHQACLAGKAKARGKSSLWGCLLGIGAAALTAGSAAPIALGGCGLGLAAGPTDSECGEAPECSTELDDYRKDVLSTHRLDGVPLCSTFLGIELEDRGDGRANRWTRVTHVVGEGPASRAGVQVDDDLVRVQNVAVTTKNDVILVLNAVEPGAALDLVVRRGGLELALTATTSTRAAGAGL